MPECGYGPHPSYLTDILRFQSGGSSDGHGSYTFRMSEEDLPVLGRIFNLGWGLEEQKIHWNCLICGDIGSRLHCDPEKHAEFYDALAEAGSKTLEDERLVPLERERWRKDLEGV